MDNCVRIYDKQHEYPHRCYLYMQVPPLMLTDIFDGVKFMTVPLGVYICYGFTTEYDMGTFLSTGLESGRYLGDFLVSDDLDEDVFEAARFRRPN